MLSSRSAMVAQEEATVEVLCDLSVAWDCAWDGSEVGGAFGDAAAAVRAWGIGI